MIIQLMFCSAALFAQPKSFLIPVATPSAPDLLASTCFLHLCGMFVASRFSIGRYATMLEGHAFNPLGGRSRCPD